MSITDICAIIDTVVEVLGLLVNIFFVIKKK